MNSKLRPTLVGMGIAFGATLPGCLGRASADRDGPSDRVQDPDGPEEYEVQDGQEPLGDDFDDPAAPDDDQAPAEDNDPTIAAFCDATWPPTKGRPDPPTPLCVDPDDECQGVDLPRQCYRLIDERTCNYEEPFTGPLYCVDGAWECPPGSTVGFTCLDDECENECICWGPLPEGYMCGENGLVGIGGATGTD